ncbi:PREDICTED: uncharacterized protein LOC102023357 [Chinchilla lanigera]|uniref:uncharacterized protein LOC102023357 n=1 Tax=Chinchilla lanigera TaxID=34839 RepID=UPI00038EC258|nr:PREDICTED: uncharacterized protein LOC102023357 [Chinchilla lanigera]
MQREENLTIKVLEGCEESMNLDKQEFLEIKDIKIDVKIIDGLEASIEKISQRTEQKHQVGRFSAFERGHCTAEIIMPKNYAAVERKTKDHCGRPTTTQRKHSLEGGGTAEKPWHASEKIINNAEASKLVVPQLAFENANKWCKEASRAHTRRAALLDMIRICADIAPHMYRGLLWPQLLLRLFTHGLEEKVRDAKGTHGWQLCGGEHPPASFSSARLLSHTSAGFGPGPCRPSCRDVGVQVNQRCDPSVQCMLGGRHPAPGRDQESQLPPRSLAACSPLQAGAAPAAGTAGDRRDAIVTVQETSLPRAEPSKKHLRLQERKGCHHCKDSNICWESAFVWCIQGTNKVYFKQRCRMCQNSYNPYQVKDITCQSCKRTKCSYPVRFCHVDPKHSHRQDLCDRCGSRRPCWDGSSARNLGKNRVSGGQNKSDGPHARRLGTSPVATEAVTTEPLVGGAQAVEPRPEDKAGLLGPCQQLAGPQGDEMEAAASYRQSLKCQRCPAQGRDWALLPRGSHALPPPCSQPLPLPAHSVLPPAHCCSGPGAGGHWGAGWNREQRGQGSRQRWRRPPRERPAED